MTAVRVTLLLAGLAIGGSSAGSVVAAEAEAAGSLRVDPSPVAVGGIAVVRLAARAASGSFDGDPLPFFAAGPESVALVGIDLDRAPGEYPLHVTTAEGAEIRTELRVVGKEYPVERLKVARAYTDLDPKTLERVGHEQQRLEALWASPAQERLWRGAFAMPAKGPAGSPFGLRRFFNGEPRSPHAGIDIKAPKGAPVTASNRGRVVLADELFFTGKTVVLDHGLGLFTLYVHLSEIAAKPETVVERGGAIGKVGATGRVTGPHLHFAARLGTARVDPEALLGRAIERDSGEERKTP